MSKGRSTYSSRRLFLGALAVGSGWYALRGCDNFAGVGDDPSGRGPAVKAGTFGISVDFYTDGTFRVNADPRRVVLHGLFALGVMPARGFLAAGALLTLLDHADDKQWLLGITCSGIVGYMGDRFVDPLFELDVDIDELAADSITVEVLEAGESKLPETVLVSSPEEIEGSWTAYGIHGAPLDFRIMDWSPHSNSMLIDSSTFVEPARFDVSDAVLVGLVSGDILELSGRVSGRFESDPTRRVRSAPLVLRCLDRNTIQAETRYIKWDRTGRVMDSAFWPLRMNRV